jgi:hypothetical protein
MAPKIKRSPDYVQARVVQSFSTALMVDGGLSAVAGVICAFRCQRRRLGPVQTAADVLKEPPRE